MVKLRTILLAYLMYACTNMFHTLWTAKYFGFLGMHDEQDGYSYQMKRTLSIIAARPDQRDIEFNNYA